MMISPCWQLPGRYPPRSQGAILDPIGVSRIKAVRLIVTELELIEPFLFLDTDSQAPQRFASAVRPGALTQRHPALRPLAGNTEQRVPALRAAALHPGGLIRRLLQLWRRYAAFDLSADLITSLNAGQLRRARVAQPFR